VSAPGGSIRVAPLQAAQKECWLMLWVEYQTFYGVSLPDEVTESTWQRIREGRIHGLGAHDASNRLVGIVHFLFHEDTWSAVSACYLQDLYVEAAARGAGCARRLIEAVADSSKAVGCNPPYWLTHETNAAARLLYDRLAQNQGFIQYVYRT
jgi:GNAT superfamily N-acetyltransferase